MARSGTARAEPVDPKVGPTVDRVLQLVAKRFAEFQNTLPNERLDTRSGVEPSLDLYCLRGRPLIRNAKRIRMLPCFSVRPPSIPYPRVRLVLVGGRTFVPPRSRTRPKRRILGPFAGKRAEEPHNGRRHLADIHSAQLQGGTNVTPPAVSPPSCGGDAS